MTSEVFDLAVVGGGVIGLAHAYVAARAGRRVATSQKAAGADFVIEDVSGLLPEVREIARRLAAV